MAASEKPLLQALAGKAQARPPIWLMRQAGRYLPEYRELRAKAKDFIDLALNPEWATEITIQPVRRFGMDAAILFADILLIPHAMGQSVAFVQNEGPQLSPIRDAAGLAQLSADRMRQTLSPVMQTIKNLRTALPNDVTLIGFAGAPWTVATYMIEGHGGTDYENCRKMAWQEPALFQKIIDTLTDATIDYLLWQVEAGAEALQIFDSWAGAVPAPLFDVAVNKPTAKIVAAIKAKHPSLPIIGFPRAAGSHIADYAVKTGVNAVGVDTMTDIVAASNAVPKGVAVQGNLDPMLLFTGGDAMLREAKALCDAMAGKPYIFNLGHGVMQFTPPDHVARLVDTVKGG